MDRPTRAGAGKNPQEISPPDDRQFRQDFPRLWEMLTAVRYSDGGARQTGTMLVLVESGFWKVQLRDREEEQALWRSGSSLTDCLIEIEGALSQQSCGDWRPLQGGFTGPRKKRS